MTTEQAGIDRNEKRKANAKTHRSDWLYGHELFRSIDKFESQIRLANRPSPFSKISTKFLIACTSRTGSSLLSQSLDAYGANVKEYFNFSRIDATRKKDENIRSMQQYCRYLKDNHFSNGIMGIKGAFYCLPPLYLCSEFPENIGQWKFVHLTRNNMVRQAISLCIAQITGSWSSNQAPTATVSDEDYNRQRISKIMDTICTTNLQWEKFYAAHGITPLRITYENLTTDLESTIAQVAAYLGLDRAKSKDAVVELAPRVANQSTDLNRIWEQRFYQDVANFRIEL